MNDEQYEKTKKNLQNFTTPLKNAILLNWNIKNVYVRERASDRGVMAETSALWEYRTATITWYIPVIEEHCPTQDDVFNLVVHEYVHCIIDPISPRVESVSDDQRAIVEFVTQNVTDAIDHMFKNPTLLTDHYKSQKAAQRRAARKKQQ